MRIVGRSFRRVVMTTFVLLSPVTACIERPSSLRTQVTSQDNHDFVGMLTLHAVSKRGRPFSDQDRGHAWVEIKSLADNSVRTYSIYAKGGVQENYDWHYFGEEGAIYASRSYFFTKDEGEKLTNFIDEEKRKGSAAYNYLKNNCAHFSATAWNLITGEGLAMKVPDDGVKEPSFPGVGSAEMYPAFLREQIMDRNGGLAGFVNQVGTETLRSLESDPENAKYTLKAENIDREIGGQSGEARAWVRAKDEVKIHRFEIEFSLTYPSHKNLQIVLQRIPFVPTRMGVTDLANGLLERVGSHPNVEFEDPLSHVAPQDRQGIVIKDYQEWSGKGDFKQKLVLDSNAVRELKQKIPRGRWDLVVIPKTSAQKGELTSFAIYLN